MLIINQTGDKIINTDYIKHREDTMFLKDKGTDIVIYKIIGLVPDLRTAAGYNTDIELGAYKSLNRVKKIIKNIGESGTQGKTYKMPEE